jgi:hypothetical protein
MEVERWEYNWYYFDATYAEPNDWDRLRESLNQWGAAGWECYSVTHRHFGVNGSEYVYWMRRRLAT